MLQFFKMQLFRAALPRDLRFAQHNQNTIMLDDMYQVATDTQRRSGSKTPQAMAAVNEDSHSEAKDEEDVVAAFKNRWNNQFKNRAKRQNLGAPQRSNLFNSRAGSNTNRNRKYCYYCKIQNHRQEACRKRIHENESCKDRHGRAYWPKSYVMDTSSEKK
jgi:hypothetical protein